MNAIDLLTIALALLTLAWIAYCTLLPYLFIEVGDRTFVIGSRRGYERDMKAERAAAMRRHPAGKARDTAYDDTAFLSRVKGHIEAYGADPT